MNGTALAKRYADGFLAYAKETIGFEKGLEELKNVKNVFRDNPGSAELLESPVITYSEKCDFVDNAFRDGFTDEIKQFLKLLLKKNRISGFMNIAEYARIKYSHGEELDALLKSSYPLDTETIEALKKELEKKLKRKLHLYMDLDTDLMGGVKVTIGNMVIDGSIRRRFEDLKEKLMQVKVG